MKTILLTLLLPLSAYALDDVYNIPLNDSMTIYNNEVQQQQQYRQQQQFNETQQRQMQELRNNQQRMDMEIRRERARNANDGRPSISY